MLAKCSEAASANLSEVLVQLCEPFIEPSPARTGKGHDGFTRLDPAWHDREMQRAAVRGFAGFVIKTPFPADVPSFVQSASIPLMSLLLPGMDGSLLDCLL